MRYALLIYSDQEPWFEKSEEEAAKATAESMPKWNALFEELGAPLWAERVCEELRRIGGRTPASDELTATERQIATKVAEGLTNREVASTLFVSPKTVESTLTRVYRKLGVRSRTELTRQITRSPESKL